MLLLGVVPLVLAALVLRYEARLDVLGFDFKGTIWQPGREILAGHSPYPPPQIDEIDTGNPSVYPPLALLVGLPFSLLPFGLASWTWMATLVAAILVTLRMLGVRDWRCYTLALSSCAVVFGVALGNITLLLVPLAAYAWQHRSTAWRGGLAVGLAIALKIVLWPLLVWLIATRRAGAALVALAAAAVSTLVAWAVLGFDGFLEYPRLLALNSDLYGPHSWSLLAGAIGIGLPLGPAKVLSSLPGLALLVLSLVLATRRDGDRRAFCVAVVASIALSPIVWVYYFALLLVPIALTSARIGRVWLLLVALWLVAAVPRPLADVGAPPEGVPRSVWQINHSPPPTAQIAAFTALIALITVVVLRVAPRARVPESGPRRSASPVADSV